MKGGIAHLADTSLVDDAVTGRKQFPFNFSGRLRRRPTSSFTALLVLVILVIMRLMNRAPEVPRTTFDQEPVVVRRVVDGDTLLLESGERVRLIGIDTPETKAPDRPVQWMGPEASRFTTRLVGKGPVRLEFDRERRDQYQRLLAYVFLPDGRMVNEEIIRAGYSKAETRFPFRNDRKRQFIDVEKEAKRARRGLWSKLPPGETKSTGNAQSPGEQ